MMCGIITPTSDELTVNGMASFHLSSACARVCSYGSAPS